MNPSVAFQGAGLPSGVCQPSRFFPSNRMTASLGALAGAELTATGSTTGGLGRLMSCCNQRISPGILRSSPAARTATSPAIVIEQALAIPRDLAVMMVDGLQESKESSVANCSRCAPRTATKGVPDVIAANH